MTCSSHFIRDTLTTVIWKQNVLQATCEHMVSTKFYMITSGEHDTSFNIYDQGWELKLNFILIHVTGVIYRLCMELLWIKSPFKNSDVEGKFNSRSIDYKFITYFLYWLCSLFSLHHHPFQHLSHLRYTFPSICNQCPLSIRLPFQKSRLR